MNIYDLRNLSIKAGLKESDVALGDNPQHLTLGEINKRILNYETGESLKNCIDFD